MKLLGRRPSTALEAARGVPVVSSTRHGARLAPPRIRSGTALEVAEISWVAAGVSRETALSLTSVAAARNLIVGTIVQLGLFRFRGTERLDPGYLLSKPDPSTSMPATMGGTVDDLLFNGRAYWLVLERDSEGFPTRARWTPVADVTPNTRDLGGSYSILISYAIAGVATDVDPADVIRFDSPAPAILDTGSQTFAAALELEQAALRLSSVTIPAGVLKNEGTELGEDEATALLAKFQESRRDNGVAFLQGMSYSREDLNAADLQLLESRAAVVADVARLFGVPVAMLNGSPSGGSTALLYANLSQQLAILVTTGAAPYIRTIEDTLSDVLPRGQSTAFDVQTYLRTDPQAAADYAVQLLTAGVINQAEARALLGIPSATPDGADLNPGRV